MNNYNHFKYDPNKPLYEYFINLIPKSYDDCYLLFLLCKKYYQIIIIFFGFLLAVFSQNIFGRNGPRYFKNIVAMSIVFALFWRYISYSEEKKLKQQNMFYQPIYK